MTAHRVDAVRVWLPGPEAVGFRRTVAPPPEAGHWSTYWRCQSCGVERERPAEFPERCPAGSERSARVVADD